MEDLDVRGWFWLPEHPDQRIPGSLKFDSKNGAVLSLIGSFKELPKLPVDFDQRIRLNGIVENGDVTLDQCRRTKYRVRSPGIATEEYRAPLLFSGCRFDSDEPLEFTSVYFQLHSLQHWVGKTGIYVTSHETDRTGSSQPSHIHYTPIKESTIPLGLGMLGIAFPYKISPTTMGEVTVSENCGFRIQFSSPTSLRETLTLCSLLQDLVTVGVGKPAFPTMITLTHSDLYRELPGGRVIHDKIRLYLQSPKNGAVDAEPASSPTDMLFTYDQVRGINGVAKWLSVTRRYQVVLNVLLSDSYAQQIYSDIKFANAIIATESLIRIRTNNQRITLDNELKQLASEAGSIFQMLVGDIEAWAKEVIKTRVRNVVHRGLFEHERPRLTLLASTLYFLVVLSILRECDVPEETLSSVQAHDTFRLLGYHLKRGPSS